MLSDNPEFQVSDGLSNDCDFINILSYENAPESKSKGETHSGAENP